MQILVNNESFQQKENRMHGSPPHMVATPRQWHKSARCHCLRDGNWTHTKWQKQLTESLDRTWYNSDESSQIRPLLRNTFSWNISSASDKSGTDLDLGRCKAWRNSSCTQWAHELESLGIPAQTFIWIKLLCFASRADDCKMLVAWHCETTLAATLPCLIEPSHGLFLRQPSLFAKLGPLGAVLIKLFQHKPGKKWCRNLRVETKLLWMPFYSLKPRCH